MTVVAATATQYLSRVSREMGKKEGPNNDTVYGRWYGLNHAPYCAMGLSYCAATLGAPTLAVVGKFASCFAWEAWAKAHGTWHSGHSGIRAGDIVIYTYSHCEVVRGVTSSTILTYGFNTSSGVGSQRNGDGNYARIRPRNSLIAGYHRPRYGPGIVVQPSPIPVVHNKAVARWQYILEFAPSRRDGQYGPATEQRSEWMRTGARVNETSSTLSGSATSTIKTMQLIVDTKPDGAWGPNSHAHMKVWIRQAQAFLGVTTDGVWGPKTDAAFLSFRKKYYMQY